MRAGHCVRGPVQDPRGRGLEVFGTGLMSGGDEIANAVDGRLDYEDFSLEGVLGKSKACSSSMTSCM